MTDRATSPILDLAVESGPAPLEALVVAGIVVLALTYLLHGLRRRSTRAASGGGCGGCPGCSSAGHCPLLAHLPRRNSAPTDSH